jgi:hypothetical protein
MFTKQRLTYIGTDGALYGNVVTAIFSCYGVVSPIILCCKSDINECNYIEALVGISMLELHNVRHARLHIMYRQLTKPSSTVNV